MVSPFVPLLPAADRWPAGQVRYRIMSVPTTRPSIDIAAMSTIMKTAFARWKNAANLPLEFVEVPTDPCDIAVVWERFQGTGRDGFLATADFPPKRGTSPNVIAFNDDSTIPWAINDNVGRFDFNLAFIALHEVGHAIGLAHSAFDMVVMSDTIGMGAGFGLAPADMTAAGKLYAHPFKTAIFGAVSHLFGIRSHSHREFCGDLAAVQPSLARAASGA